MPKSMDDASCKALSFLFFSSFLGGKGDRDGAEIAHTSITRMPVIALNFSVKSMSLFYFAPLHDDLRSLA